MKHKIIPLTIAEITYTKYYYNTIFTNFNKHCEMKNTNFWPLYHYMNHNNLYIADINESITNYVSNKLSNQNSIDDNGSEDN
jgi:hypothetical protein